MHNQGHKPDLQNIKNSNEPEKEILTVCPGCNQKKLTTKVDTVDDKKRYDYKCLNCNFVFRIYSR